MGQTEFQAESVVLEAAMFGDHQKYSGFFCSMEGLGLHVLILPEGKVPAFWKDLPGQPGEVVKLGGGCASVQHMTRLGWDYVVQVGEAAFQLVFKDKLFAYTSFHNSLQ